MTSGSTGLLPDRTAPASAVGTNATAARPLTTSIALIAKLRVGGPLGQGFPVPVVAGGLAAVGTVQVAAGAALPGSGCRFVVRPGRTRIRPQAPCRIRVSLPEKYR